MRLVLFGIVGLVLFVAGIAEAGPPSMSLKPSESAEPAGPTVPEYDDYRLTLLLSDLSAISLLIGTAAVSENETIATSFVVAGLGTYALGGPVTHLFHEQPKRALASFGLRVGLPLAGIGLGVGLALGCAPGEGEGWCVIAAYGIGVIIAGGGALTAMIVDDGFLGNAPKNPPKDAHSTSAFRAGLAPLFDPRKKALGLSLVGDF